MSIIVSIIAWTIIWAATDVGRKEDSKIEAFSKNHFYQLALLIAAAMLLIVSNHLRK